MASDDRALIGRARRGDRDAARELTERLSPVVHARVRRVLEQRGAGLDRADVVHEVWVSLFEEDWRRLSAFDPVKGASLEGYVGVIAEREAINRCTHSAATKRGGSAHLMLLDAANDLASSAPDPERAAITRQTVERLEAFLSSRLSSRERLVLQYVYVDHRAPEEVAAILALEIQAIYRAQHKIRGLAREFAATQPTPPLENQSV